MNAPKPYRIYNADFEEIHTVPYLIVMINKPETGWMKAEDLETHYRELFKLGYEEEDQNLYE